MTDTLNATVQALVRSSQYARSEVEGAIEALRADPDNLAPTFTPWTDEQLSARLPALVEMATVSGRPLPSVAWAVREGEAAGVTWSTPAPPAPGSGT